MKNMKLRIKKIAAIVMAMILAVPASVTMQKPMEVKAKGLTKNSIVYVDKISQGDVIYDGVKILPTNETEVIGIAYQSQKGEYFPKAVLVSVSTDKKSAVYGSSVTVRAEGEGNGSVYNGNFKSASKNWCVELVRKDPDSDKFKYTIFLYPYPHTDSWTSKAGTGANANTLYAWCVTTDSFCDYTNDTSNYQTSTLTYSLPTGKKLPYNKSAQGLTAVNNINNKINVSSYTQTYYTDSSCKNKTTADDGITGAEGSAPANVGTYYVKATSSAGLNTLTTSYEIIKINQSATLSMSDYEYGASPSIPSLSGIEENATPIYMYYYESDGEACAKEWNSTEITSTSLKAGTYKMYATLPETRNYNSYKSGTVTFHVTGKEIQSTDLSVIPYSGVYDAEEHDISVTITKDTVKNSNSKIRFYNNLTGEYDLTESPKYKDVNTADSNNIYEVKYRVSADGYYDYDQSSTITITPKELKGEDVTVNANKTYDGTDTVSVKVKANTGIDGEELIISGVVGTFLEQENKDAKDAGEGKTVTINSTAVVVSCKEGTDTKGTNYKVIYPTQTTATISPLTAKLQWSDTDLHYNEKEQNVTVTVTNRAACDNDQSTNFNILYTGNKETNINENGTHYTVEVTELGNDNYVLPTDGSATADWTISRLEKDITVDGTKGTNGWYQSEVKAGAGEGYQLILQDLNGDSVTVDDTRWIDTQNYGGEGDHTLGYYVKELSSNALSLMGNIQLKIDTVAPTGSVSISEGMTYTSWNADWDYEKIYKDYVSVTVTGYDATSGVERIEYTIADKNQNAEELTWTSVAVTEDTSDETGQTKNGTFNVYANQKGSIWVRITDTAGNKSVINAAGIVVYTNAAATANDVTYDRKSMEDQTVTVKTNGNTVASIKNGNSILTEATDSSSAGDYSVVYTNNGNQAEITFKGSYLDSLSRKTHQLTIEYNPYGEKINGEGDTLQKTEVNLNVIRNRSGSITNISDMDKDVDGSSVNLPTFDSTNEKGDNNANVTFEYKKKGAADETYTTDAPSERGRYVVRITVKEDDDYEKVSATKEFWIHDSLMTISPRNTKVTYNGSNQGIQIEAYDQKTQNAKTDIMVEYGTLSLGNKVVYDTTPTVYKDAGSYTIFYRVSADGYETVTDSVTFTILPKPATFVWNNVEFTYNGKIQKPTAWVSNLEQGDAATVMVGDGAKDAGTHTATVSKLSNPNYTVSEGETTASSQYVVNPKTVTVKLKAEDKTYDKTTDAIITGFVPDGLEKGDSLAITGKGTFDKAGAGKEITVTPDTSESSMQVTGNGSTNAGNYKLIYDTTETLTATIKKADRQIRVTDLSNPMLPAFTADDGDSTDTSVDAYQHKTVTYKNQGEADSNYSELTELPKKCGTYIIRVTIPEDENYLESIGAAKYTVAHNWTGNWETVTKATTAKEGTKVKYCKNEGCKEKIYGTIDKLTEDGSSSGTGDGTSGGSTSNGGDFEKTIRVEKGSTIGSALLLNAKNQLMEDGKIITNTDKNNLSAGTKNIIINLVVSKTETDTLTDADTASFKQYVTLAGNDESTLTYFDVDVYKIAQTKSNSSSENFDNENTSKITETASPLKISLTLPSSLRASGNVTRTYQVLRLHEGSVAVLLSSYDNSTNQLSFESNLFSTYAIAYKDIINSNSGGNSNNNNGSDDGDSSTGSNSNSTVIGNNENNNTLINSKLTKKNNSSTIDESASKKNSDATVSGNNQGVDSSLDDTYSSSQKNSQTALTEEGTAGYDETKADAVDYDEAKADTAGQNTCSWHWLILTIALLGFLATVLVGWKNRKYSLIAAIITTAFNLIIAIVGHCRLDWFFLLAEVVLMIGIMLCLLHGRNEKKSAV